MKKLFLVAIIAITGCTQIETNGTVKSGEMEFHVVKIGNCEYVGRHLESNSAILTHKGDCSNPIHKYNIVETTDTLTVGASDSLKTTW